MQHPLSSRSKRVRFAMIPALVFAFVAGCADQEPTSPDLPSVSRDLNVPFNKFFVAWSRTFNAAPIQTQIFSLDHRQNRQYGEWYVSQPVLSFAQTHPGRLYIVGDEPDQYCVAPADYAEWYHEFVRAVRGVDPSSRFSPAGVAEPNERCCAEGDTQCMRDKHSIGWMDQFYNAYVQRYGVAPQVAEWRFHNFGLESPVGDVDHWWASVQKQVDWSLAHGAKMVLGAWGFMRWREPTPAVQEHMKQAIGRIMSEPRIVEAVYWSHEPWIHSVYPLVNDDGSLTPEGQTFVNPLTDVPVEITTIASTSGRAMLRWVNTTAAWSAEAEFWVKAPGSDSFVYHSTERLVPAGSRETSLATFRLGDTVKGRVRYYNLYGQAGWSSYSVPVVIDTGEPPAKAAGAKKPGSFCFLPTGIQSQSCN